MQCRCEGGNGPHRSLQVALQIVRHHAVTTLPGKQASSWPLTRATARCAPRTNAAVLCAQCLSEQVPIYWCMLGPLHMAHDMITFTFQDMRALHLMASASLQPIRSTDMRWMIRPAPLSNALGTEARKYYSQRPSVVLSIVVIVAIFGPIDII